MEKNFSLAHQVFQRLEQAIITEELPGGTELTELGLSTTYGVSRTPIREAVAMLEQEDLVESRGKKIIVLGFSKQDIRELCPSLSISSIEGALRKLVEAGELKREGNGKNTCYYRVKEYNQDLKR